MENFLQPTGHQNIGSASSVPHPPPLLAKANGGLGHGPTSHRQGPPSLPLAPTRGRQGPHFPLWLVPEAGMGQPGPSAPPPPLARASGELGHGSASLSEQARSEQLQPRAG
jgi:hypothetical protein